MIREIVTPEKAKAAVDRHDSWVSVSQRFCKDDFFVDVEFFDGDPRDKKTKCLWCYQVMDAEGLFRQFMETKK